MNAYYHQVVPAAISHFREPRQYFPILRAAKRVLQAAFPTKCQGHKYKRQYARSLVGQMTSHRSFPPAGPTWSALPAKDAFDVGATDAPARPVLVRVQLAAIHVPLDDRIRHTRRVPDFA
jgi:hypothetical protein